MKDNFENFENFEKAMEILKNTVDVFNDGKLLNLDEIVNNYELGMNAYNYCAKKLEETHKKIKIIESDLSMQNKNA